MSYIFCKNKFLLLLFFINPLLISAQNIGTLSGRVIDNQTQEPLGGATIILKGTTIGVITDANGYFSFNNISTEYYNVEASYLGFRSQILYNVIVKSAGTRPLLFKLDKTSEALNEVILSTSPFRTTKETPLSTQSLSAVEIETYPGGNNDITKVAQSLPGISPSIGGFRNDFIIRGGAPNENVYYLDGVEIPNINHFSTQGSAGGPVGMLNVSFIREITLSTSAFGAEYDNPLSGVLVFEQRDGNNQKHIRNVRIGASEVGVTFNGPLFKKDYERPKTTLILSARRSYLQFIFALVGLPIRPDYWDYQWKLSHKIDARNNLTFIGLGSIDDFSVKAPNEFDARQQAVLEQVPIIQQKTITLGVTWKHKLKNGKGQINTTLSTNQLKNNFTRYSDNENKTGILFRNDSKEQEVKLRVHATRYNDDWKFSYGFNIQQSLYSNNTNNSIDNFKYETSINFIKYGIFGKVSRSFLKERLSLAFGVRTDADSFSTGSNMIDNISPRFSASYLMSESNSWKLNASIGRYYKIPTYTMLGFQSNVRTFINQSNRYTQSDHYVLGVEHNLNKSSRITIEFFLKKYSQYPVSISDGVSLANKGGGFEVLGNEPVTDIGSGESKGIELLFQQKLTKNFYGIFAYTFFSSEFSGIQNVTLPSVWDSRNLLSFTGGYKLNRNWEISMRYRYSGATPFVPTDVDASLISYPKIVLDYSRLGQEKLPSFNQGDIRIDKKWNFKKLSFNFYFEVQNFLAQENPSPDSYGLARDDSGNIITPQKLENLEANNTQENNQPLPTLGFIFDF